MLNRRSLAKAGIGALMASALPLARSNPAPWMTAAEMPVGSQEIYPTAWNGEIWSAGGIASGTVMPFISDRVDVYSPADNRWRPGPALPEARHHVTLLAGSRNLFAIGGYYGSLVGGIWQIRDTVWRLAERRWVTHGQLPEARAEMTSAVIAGAFHLIGGRVRKSEGSQRSDYRDTKDHLVLPPGETEWHTARPASVDRNSAAGGLLDGRLFVTGGRNDSGNLTLTEAWDPSSDRWTRCAPLPVAQAGLGGAVLDGHLYVFGGEVFAPNARVFSESWRYDPKADRWEALPPMRTPRHGLGAVALNGRVYAIGGATEPGGSGRSTALEMLDPRHL